MSSIVDSCIAQHRVKPTRKLKFKLTGDEPMAHLTRQIENSALFNTECEIKCVIKIWMPKKLDAQ